MKKILIVEDDITLLSVYKEAFESDNFEVKTAEDGIQTLKVLKSFIPNIILLDLVLPKKSGFDVLEEMNNNPQLKKIPVIIATNLCNDIDKKRALDLGAKDYFAKCDYNPAQIIDKVRKYIK